MGVRDSDPPSDARLPSDALPITERETPNDTEDPGPPSGDALPVTEREAPGDDKDPALPFARTALSHIAPEPVAKNTPAQPALAAPAANKRQRPGPQPERLRAAMNAALDRATAGSPKADLGSGDSSAPPAPRAPSVQNLRKTGSPSSPSVNQGVPKSRGEIAKRVAVRIFQVTLVLLALGALAVFFTVRHYEANLPSIEQLKAGYDPPQVTRVLARDGTLLANLFTERRTVVPFTDIPSHVKQAFLAAEDASFYEHEGLDYLGMLRALAANLRAGKTTQGGSTITQQVIKNVLLDSERSYKRKIRETILARKVEQHLTKDEIFGLYLNHIYLGHGRYGVEEAARYYFGKRVKEIDIAEAALLAGIVAAPERYSPRKHPERALDRRRYVLEQMLKKGFMTPEVHGHASIVPMKLAPAVEAESELCPEVIATVRQVLEEVEPNRARRGGYTVHTTIDPALQAAARQAVRKNLDQYLKRQKLEPPYTLKTRRLWGKPFEGTPERYRIYVGTVMAVNDGAGTIDVQVGGALGRVVLRDEDRFNPRRLPPSQFTQPGALLRVAALESPSKTSGPIPLRLELGPQGALVAIDVRTREVRALVGSYEAVMGGLDRTGSSAKDESLLTKRQPGSAFKPLMYSYALHSRHFTPASVFEFPNKPGSAEATRWLSLRSGVAKSDNDVAEAVLKKVGAANVVEWARAMGIGSALKPDKSLALGSYEVSVFEITNAYTTLAAGGNYAPPKVITKIVVPDGSELPLPPQPPKRRVMSEEEAYLTTSLLRGVVEEGTGRRARALERPVAGKTGTTNDNRDAWFVGYSTDMVTGAWVGYDDNLPLGWGEYGAVAALPAWLDFMQVAHKDKPHTQFPRPSGIVKAKVDPRTGLLPYPGQEDAVDEEFLPDAVPTESAPVPNDVTETEPGTEGAPSQTPDQDPDAPAEAPKGPPPSTTSPAPPNVVANTSPTAGAVAPLPEAPLPEAEPPPF